MRRRRQAAVLWVLCAWAAVEGPGAGQVAKTVGDAPVLVREDAAAGLELWNTALGSLWIPRPGVWVIKHLDWEQAVQKVYDHPNVRVRRGDVVIDCGAHIGGFTRVALQAGARRVVAIEPETLNLRALRRNLEPELASGRVTLVEKGVWDLSGKLPLHRSDVGDSHSLVASVTGPGDQTIEVTTLDALAEALKLERVDFIKMDIEGAERRALRGARQLLRRHGPRLAISAYHQKGDPAAIAGIVWEARPEYLVESKDLVETPHGTVTKVLFFRLRK
jgi:FkbM family methyltransferase